VSAPDAERDGIRVRCDYPGGNIKVNEIGREAVNLEQDLRDTGCWWFYWNFCAAGAAGREIRFDFADGEVLGPWGPAVSADRVEWNWLGSESLLSRSSFRYRFSGSEDEVFFSFSLPYQLSRFERFFETLRGRAPVTRGVLAVSEEGRPIPHLELGSPESDRHILLTCRHHACESVASYVLEGLLSQLVETTPSAVLERYRLQVVPFVDLDGVENGDQGKNRTPHDHCGDYGAEQRYRATAAVLELAKDLNVVAAIDFHCPWKWGGLNDHPFFSEGGSPREEVARLGDHLARVTAGEGEVVYEKGYDVGMGEKWNKPESTTFKRWFTLRGARIATSFEFPYFGTAESVVTQEGARRFGRSFARALEAYLAEVE
jgi:hypothetical protein